MSRPATSAGRVNLGEIIKETRKAHVWTLDDASQRTGVARSTLSKIENGNMSPTYDLLCKIAVGMNLDLVDLFDTRRQNAPFGRRSVTRASEGKLHRTTAYVYELLATDLAHKKMLPFKTTIKARKIDEFGEWIRHEGEEFMLVVVGAVEVHTEFYSPVTLGEGDSIYFDSKMGHAVLSVGPRDADVIWVCTGLRTSIEPGGV
jgi:transcriptional regulator with XRE-family HTH domain